MSDELIERALFLASGQDDPHSVTITELCAALRAQGAVGPPICDCHGISTCPAVPPATPAVPERAEGGESALAVAARELIAGMSSTYKARNGREVEIEADDGEKCWIVHSELIAALEGALAQPSPAPSGEGNDPPSLLRELHAAMADIMELRRLSTDQQQRDKAGRAINVWRKVEAFLSTPTNKAGGESAEALVNKHFPSAGGELRFNLLALTNAALSASPVPESGQLQSDYDASAIPDVPTKEWLAREMGVRAFPSKLWPNDPPREYQTIGAGMQPCSPMDEGDVGECRRWAARAIEALAFKHHRRGEG